MVELPAHPTIVAFVQESNRIEGISGVKSREVTALLAFLNVSDLSVGNLVDLCRAFQPDAVLRNEEGLDVRVADHVPLAGGPEVARQLCVIVDRARDRDDPWKVHLAFENLHPFTDGNGRTGRALWAWQMVRQGAPGRYALALGFLHEFYYQTLSRQDALVMRVATLERALAVATGDDEAPTSP